jgi:hypothetical protein
MQNQFVKPFLSGGVIGAIIASLLFIVIKGCGTNNTDKSVSTTLGLVYSPDGYVEREGVEKNDTSYFRKYKKNHSKAYSTYYIDSAGFKQIVMDTSYFGFRIDLGCNGIENDSAHMYKLYFSGWKKDGSQYFVKDPNSKGDAYLDKTCPCPQGSSCPCQTK